MKIRDVLKRLHEDGWEIVRQEGSHRILKHPTKRGIVVVAGHASKDIKAGTLQSVWKQAGLL
jgi:predicted RNA binding protein YcfA (HicA-like mRNA interferase family)